MATHALGPVTREGRAALLRGIYVILNENERALESARAVLDAGVRIVQYRAKRGIVLERLHALRALTRECGALLIANDDWRAAAEYDCDGVHLGPGDGGFEQVALVRAALPERLIGLSCGTIAEAHTATGADYLGVGSVYATASKDDAGDPIGIAGLRAIVRETPLPVAAIGGIDASRLAEVRSAGAEMAAVISAIAGADDPGRAARELVAAWR